MQRIWQSSNWSAGSNSQFAGILSDAQIQDLLDALKNFLLPVYARLQEETKAMGG